MYWDETKENKIKIELELGDKIESSIANFFTDKIYKCDCELSLSRNELQNIKKFVLTQLMRTLDNSYDYWYGNKDIYENGCQLIYKIGRQKKYKDFSTFTEKQAMLHELQVILDNDFEDIFEHEDSTPNLCKFWSLMNSGYLGFWRADEQNDFIITDTYLVNESDRLVRKNVPKAIPMFTKQAFLAEVIEKYAEDEEVVKSAEYNRVIQLLYNQVNFHENVWFFPITNSLMIVLINPFFKEVEQNRLLNDSLKTLYEVGYNSKIPIKHFEFNNAYYENQEKISRKYNEAGFKFADYYSEKDRYIYAIQKLDGETVQYINTLMLDSVTKEFGFKDKSKIINSVKSYIDNPAKDKLRDYKTMYSMILVD